MKQSDLPPFQRPCPFPVCDLKFDRRGNCRACGKPVVDLSAGTESEARRFLEEGRRSCVAYAVDAAGRVVFGRGALTASLAVAAAGAAALAVQLEPDKEGCGAPPPPPTEVVRVAEDVELPELEHPREPVAPTRVQPTRVQPTRVEPAHVEPEQVYLGMMMPSVFDEPERKGG